MAADDQKLETFKGEVRRIMVDLRALARREDSPLSEFAYARQLAIFKNMRTGIWYRQDGH